MSASSSRVLIVFGLVALGSLRVGVDGFTKSFISQQTSLKKDSFKPSPPFVFQARRNNPEYTVVEDDDDDLVPTEGTGDTLSPAVESKADDVSIIDNDNNDLIAKVEAEMNSPPQQQAVGKKQRPEYGALAPGTVVQVQIGDISLARKAWKKRRRTGSPLLVPCSVLNVDRQSMVRWNLIYLLEKFGRSQRDGISVSETELSKHYRNFLKYPLSQQATNLGYESTHDMIKALFNKKVQESYGVRLVEQQDPNAVVNSDFDTIVALKAPISRRKAQQRASRAPLLQFRLPREDDHGDADTLTHTGYIRSRDDTNEEDGRRYNFLPLSAALRVSQKDDVDTGKVEEGSIHPAVVFDFDVAGDGGSPLLTLSLNPGGVRESLKVKPDRKYTPIEHPRLMLNELSVGNGPYSAKVVRLLPGKALVDLEVGRSASAEGMVKVLGSLRFQDAVDVKSTKDHQSSVMMMPESDEVEDDVETENIIESALEDLYDIDDEDDDDDDDFDDEEDDNLEETLLSLRDASSFEEGTFEEGEDVEDITHMFQVVDGELSYTDPDSGETTVVNTADDEEEDEEDEDLESYDDEEISDMFEMNADGSLTYIDPDTGESEVFDQDDEDFAEMMKVKEIIDEHKTPSKGFKKESPASSTPQQTKSHVSSPDILDKKSLPIKRLRVGDDLQVYIRSVSKQSSQFTVTLNPSVQGRKAKELKREDEAQKKLARLEKKLGGSLEKIWRMEGEECDGTVKATSHSGDWVYVEVQGLPVGVATLDADETAVATNELTVGDTVRVRMVGIDEKRGQLSMHVIDKLHP